MYRTYTCGELRATHLNQQVTLAGWVDRRRDHGGVIFLDLRDRYGVVQVTINPNVSRETLEAATNVRMEWVLQVTGTVHKRPAGMENPKMETGDVEVIAEGRRTVLDNLLNGLYRGPRSAYVTKINTEWSEATGEFKDFIVRSTG